MEKSSSRSEYEIFFIYERFKPILDDKKGKFHSYLFQSKIKRKKHDVLDGDNFCLYRRIFLCYGKPLL